MRRRVTCQWFCIARTAGPGLPLCFLRTCRRLPATWQEMPSSASFPESERIGWESLDGKILAMLQRGDRPKAIAESLGLNPKTVGNRVLKVPELRAARRHKHIDDSDRAEILERSLRGETAQSLAVRFRRPLRTIHAIRAGDDGELPIFDAYRCCGCGHLVVYRPCLICKTRGGKIHNVKRPPKSEAEIEAWKS